MTSDRQPQLTPAMTAAAGLPMSAQYLAGSLPHLSAPALTDVRGGRVNSRRVRAELAQLSRRMPWPLMPSRADMSSAVRILITRGIL